MQFATSLLLTLSTHFLGCKAAQTPANLTADLASIKSKIDSIPDKTGTDKTVESIKNHMKTATDSLAEFAFFFSPVFDAFFGIQNKKKEEAIPIIAQNLSSVENLTKFNSELTNAVEKGKKAAEDICKTIYDSLVSKEEKDKNHKDLLLNINYFPKSNATFKKLVDSITKTQMTIEAFKTEVNTTLLEDLETLKTQFRSSKNVSGTDFKIYWAAIFLLTVTSAVLIVMIYKQSITEASSEEKLSEE